jgi:hypothetical protein
MTTSIEELRALVAQSILSTEAFKNQLAASQEAADRRAEAVEQSLEALKAQIAASQEAAVRGRETLNEDNRASRKQANKQLKKLRRQIGGLGNKFNRFTDGLGLPLVGKFLFKRFGIEDFMPRRYKCFGGEFIEFGAHGLVNGSRNEAYIVEIKSHLRSDALEQMRSTLGRFRSIFTEYRQMKLYGVIVAGDASAEALHEARQAGFYVISFDDNIMHFHDGDGFVPKAY